MAEYQDIVSALVTAIPRSGNSGAVSVGFQDRSSFKPFMDELYTVLCNVRDKVIENQNNNAAADQRNQEESQKTWKEFIQKSIEEYERRKRENKELLDAQKELADSLKEKDDNFKTFLAYAQRGLNYSFEVMDKHLEAVRRVSDVYLDLESSGVFLSNGFGDLGQVAHNLGMTYEDLAGHLKKTSPLISKLNGTMGDGLKIFDSAINGIDKSLNLSNSEKVSVFESVLSKISPSQLLQMSQAEMNIEVNKAAKELKMLSLATGKSVDLIAQENKQKEQTLRGRAWERAHPEAMRTLRAYGFGDDEEIKEYLMNGGHITSPTLALRIAGSEAMQAMLPQMARLAATGQLNEKSMSQLAERYKYLAAKDLSRSEANSRDSRQMMAGKASANYELVQFDNRFSESILEKNTKDMEKQYYSDARKSSNEAVGNAQGIGRNLASIDSDMTTLTSGGPEGVANTLSYGDMITSKIKDLTGWVQEKFPKGTFGGLLASAGMESLPYVGKYIGSRITNYFTNRSFSKAVNKFSDAVDRFVNPNGGGNGGDNDDENSIWNRGKRWAKEQKRKASNWLKTNGMTIARGAAGVAGAGVGLYGIIDTLTQNQKGKSLGESAFSSGLYGTVSGALLGFSIRPDLMGIGIGALVGGGLGAIIGVGKNIFDNWGTGNYNWETVKSSANSIFGGTGNLLIGAIVGATIGKLSGDMVLGTLVGAGYPIIATRVTNFINELSSGNFSSSITSLIGNSYSESMLSGAIFGATIGRLNGNMAMGAVIGAGWGAILQTVNTYFKNGFAAGFQNMSGGSFADAAFKGAIFGGTIGAQTGQGWKGIGIGAVLGAGINGILNIGANIFNDIKNGNLSMESFTGNDYGDAALRGAILGGTIGFFVGGAPGILIGAAIGGVGLPAIKGLISIIKKCLSWLGIKSDEAEDKEKEKSKPKNNYQNESGKQINSRIENDRKQRTANTVKKNYNTPKYMVADKSSANAMNQVPMYPYNYGTNQIQMDDEDLPDFPGETSAVKLPEANIEMQSSVPYYMSNGANTNTGLYHPNSELAYQINSEIENKAQSTITESEVLKALKQISENTSHTKQMNSNIEELIDVNKEIQNETYKVRLDNNLNNNHPKEVSS